jgi:hypothetical protein
LGRMLTVAFTVSKKTMELLLLLLEKMMVMMVTLTRK